METAIKNTPVRVENNLRLQWPLQQAKDYGVRIVFEDADGQNEIKYQVRITRLNPSAKSEALFRIERTTEVFINEAIPDLVADRLAYVAGKVFYPLIIVVDKNGGFKSIANHDQILKRWANTKAEIHQNFEGQMVENYVARMEKQLALCEYVQQALINNDWFLQAFFKPIYKTYGTDYLSNATYRFPSVKTLDIEGYATHEEVSRHLSDFGAIELVHSGKLVYAEEPEIAMFKNIGSYEGRYILHPKTKHILAVLSDFTSQDHDRTNVKLKIFNIPANGQPFDHDFNAETRFTHSQHSGMVVIDGTPKKSFWEKLLNI